ncbi:NACHT domain-containing NTPase [Pseudomonas vranovensis]|uniref:Uncharacterized protein n=1 Tax=Pseudomonas vranovensis TaxID=321661 RepID=A0A423DGR0_9PSED|nr:hypothetical protein [Pseudomonas vranovensis]ROL70732.1 hypothetical protein BHU25_16875 [Pseudomonas vranovensis]
MPPVPLTRHFTPIPDSFQKEDHPLGEFWLGYSHGEKKTWDELFSEYRVVILAEAGAGKTYELKWAARLLAARDKAAFFIRVEDLMDGFEAAFEVGTAEAFATWLEGADEAWFFLDSVDEIRLTEARAFELALRCFASRIGQAGQRAHIYISSRPYAWRPQRDRSFVEEVLPFDSQVTSLNGGASTDDTADTQVSHNSFSAITTENRLSSLRLYQLTPLGKDDVRMFAEHSGVADSNAFMNELERGDLFSLAQLPFDLRDLISTWNDEQAFSNRLTILQDSVRRQLSQAVQEFPGLTLPRLEEAAQLLAISVVLTGVSSIGLPGSSSAVAIEPSNLLGDWSSTELTALLTSGIFGEPVYGEVRFRHREIRELLAAHWISNRLGSEANRLQMESWIFRWQYGRIVLSSRLRPLLPWLILFDAPIRDRVIAEYPDVVLEGGDAAALPLSAREETLSHLLAQITDATSSLKGLDSGAIVRIARPDLEQLTLSLIDRHFDSDDAIFFLGRLVWQGKMGQCAERLFAIGSDPARDVYTRIVSVRAIASLSGVDRFYELWRAVLAGEPPIPRALFTEMVEHAPPLAESVDLILQTLPRSGKQNRYRGTGLTNNLTGLVQRLPLSEQSNAVELLHVFAEGLLVYLKHEPHFERGECAVSKEYHWLMPIALQCVERLVRARSPQALSTTSLTILSAVPALLLWQDVDVQVPKSKLAELIPEWHELNDALFWWTVAECRCQRERAGQDLRDDWPMTWPEHFWAFDEASFARTLAWVKERPLVDDRYVALARAHRTYTENGKPEHWRDQLLGITSRDVEIQATLQVMLNPSPDPAALRYQAQNRKFQRQHARRQQTEKKERDTFVAHLRANPEIIRHPPGLKADQLSHNQANLLAHVREGQGLSKRSEGSNWTALIPEFGDEVAEAYRDAATAFWRAYQPQTRSEGAEPNSIPYAVVFGLAGLDIELENSRAIVCLSEAEVESAMRYALWEINGFPRWFEALFQQWPAAASKVLRKEIEWELSTELSGQSSYYVLHDLVYHAPDLHDHLAPVVYQWLSEHQVLNQECLGYSRAIMTAGGIHASDIAILATKKVEDSTTPSELLPIWHAIRTDADPALSLPKLEIVFRRGSAYERAEFGERFSVALLGGRRDTVKAIGKFKTPTYLKQLYLLIHSVVRVADDLDRANTGVYSPTLRDDAQDARERLFGLLSEIPRQIAYQAVLELAETHPVPRFRAYMRSCALQRAMEEADPSPWRIEQVALIAADLDRHCTVERHSEDHHAKH